MGLVFRMLVVYCKLVIFFSSIFFFLLAFYNTNELRGREDWCIVYCRGGQTTAVMPFAARFMV